MNVNFIYKWRNSYMYTMYTGKGQYNVTECSVYQTSQFDSCMYRCPNLIINCKMAICDNYV